MTNDPQNFGLGELGQRMQALSDPAPEPRLRPYQGGGPLPGAATERPAPVPEPPAQGPPPPYSAWNSGYPTAPAAPTAPEPYPELGAHNRSSNGHSGNASSTSSSSPGSPSSASNTPSPSGLGSSGSTPSSSSGYGQAPIASETPAALPPPAAPVDPNAPKSGLQRAIDAVRSTLPLVQRLLPLLEGNVATAITALMAPQASHHPPPQVKVDLEPVERGLAEVRTSHRELRTQVAEQGTSLKRVEDQLERVREATDRNTLEQQELVEDLRSVGSRISTFALIGLGLLILSLVLNIYFVVQLQHILR